MVINTKLNFYATVLATAVSGFFFLFIWYRLELKRVKRSKPSVTDKDAYHEAREAQGAMTGLYETPGNYERKNGKLVAVNPQLQQQEKHLNSTFRDKIPWCLPPTYGDLDMNGAFPSVKTCRLEALCKLMKENTESFTSEFNMYKQGFVENPEKLGYGNRYGKIDINEGDETMFTKTRRVLGSSIDYVRTQVFNKHAGYNVLSTTFTVLYPGASIRPHFGPTNYKYRIHLCLDIDGEGGIVTAYGTRYWRVGEIFILDDSYLHAGFYEGNRPRVIIMVDIAKPGLTLKHIENIFETASKKVKEGTFR